MKNIKINKEIIKQGLEKEVSSLGEYCICNTIMEDVKNNSIQDKYIIELEKDVPIGYRIALKESVTHPFKIEDMKESVNEHFWFDCGIGIMPCVEILTNDFKKELKEEIEYKINAIKNWFIEVDNLNKLIQKSDYSIFREDTKLKIQELYDNIEEHIRVQKQSLKKLNKILKLY